MKRFVPLLITLALPGLAVAQPTSFEPQGQTVLAGQRRPTQISIMPLYQQFEDDDVELTEVSAAFFLFVPIGRNLGMGLRAYGGTAEVTGISTSDATEPESISGLADAQVTLSYYQPVGSGSVVANVAVNLPTGQQQLTPMEFLTVAFISQNLYGFQVPSFAQGFSVAPSLTIAFPLGEQVAGGLGVSYNYRDTFEPLENMEDAYDPGDEVLLTGGFDVRFTPQTTFSADASYALYQADEIGEQEVFQAGDKTVVSAQLRHAMGRSDLWLFGRYRSRAKNDLLNGDELILEEERTTPNEIEAMGRFTFPAGQRLAVGLLAEARIFDETPVFEAASVFGGGLAPTLVVSPSVRIPARFLYFGGDVTGFEVGVGLAASF